MVSTKKRRFQLPRLILPPFESQPEKMWSTLRRRLKKIKFRKRKQKISDSFYP